jgi:hypothetical protein
MPVPHEGLRPDAVADQPPLVPPQLATEAALEALAEQRWRESWAEALNETTAAGPQIAAEYDRRVTAAKTHKGKGREEVIFEEGDDEENSITTWVNRRSPEELAAEALHPDTIIAGIVRRRPNFRSLRAWGKLGTWRAALPDRIVESVDPKDGGAIGWTILSRQVARPAQTAQAPVPQPAAPAAAEAHGDLDIDDEPAAASSGAKTVETSKRDPSKNRQNIVLTADGRLLVVEAPDDTRFDGVMRFARPHPRSGLSERRVKREKERLTDYMDRNREVAPRFSRFRKEKDPVLSFTPREGISIGYISLKRLVEGRVNLGAGDDELAAADVLEGLDRFVYDRQIPIA